MEYVVPKELDYFEDFITPVEQTILIEHCSRLPLQPIIGPGGHPSRRVKKSFGREYDVQQRRSVTAPPIPDWLLLLRQKCLACCQAHGIAVQDELNQCSIQRYQPGDGIGKHVDSVIHYGGIILGVSLGTQAIMRFRHTSTGTRYDLSLDPCSLLVLKGSSRYEWSHEIPVTSIKDQTRWSVTWRHYYSNSRLAHKRS